MTEVTRISQNQFGLFATKSYNVGGIILDELEPILRREYLTLTSPSQYQQIVQDLKWNQGDQVDDDESLSCRLWRLIPAFPMPPKGYSDSMHGNKFKAMIQAALCFLNCQLETSHESFIQFFQLYHPSPTHHQHQEQNSGTRSDVDEEEFIIQLSFAAIQEVERAFVPESRLHQQYQQVGSRFQTILSSIPAFSSKSKGSDSCSSFVILQTVVLIWACNAFEGGRVYHNISRINHSCDPNAIVQPGTGASDDNRLIVRAAAPISPGDEISISYLGLFLYTSTECRQQQLRRTKHFVCHCTRCLAKQDWASVIPSLIAYPRTALAILDEDVQYDDEQSVRYMVSVRQDDSAGTAVWQSLALPSSASENSEQHEVIIASSSSETSLRKFQTIHDRLSEKLAKFLLDQQSNQTHRSKSLITSAMSPLHQHGEGGDKSAPPRNTSSTTTKDENDDDESTEAEMELLEQMTSMARSYLGDRHWATNIPLLLGIDCELQEIHCELMDTTAVGNGDDDVSTRLAQVIDSLERVCRFVDGLRLRIHRGHLLCHVVVGVARALVSLGDVKSQKYAAQWLRRVTGEDMETSTDHVYNYVTLFEDQMMQKVVVSLEKAWTRNDDRDLTHNNKSFGSSKRAKR
jgi:SET domain